ncbi:MAG: hypothetical protein JNG88_12610 [Phycisphaerales bacterium]|nr:hypothetical protein [Phycisphaerales bacterium]
MNRARRTDFASFLWLDPHSAVFLRFADGFANTPSTAAELYGCLIDRIAAFAWRSGIRHCQQREDFIQDVMVRIERHSLAQRAMDQGWSIGAVIAMACRYERREFFRRSCLRPDSAALNEEIADTRDSPCDQAIAREEWESWRGWFWDLPPAEQRRLSACFGPLFEP